MPIFVNSRNRGVAGAVGFIVAMTIYLGTNHVHLRAPQLLPFTWVDANVPFIPSTVWIYNSDYVLFAAVYALLCADLEALNNYCFSFLSLILVSGLIFMNWPTTYPRDRFPLPSDLNAPTAYVFNLLRRADTPANCCPSLHVSGVYLSSFAIFDRRRITRFALFLAWATLIAISTLTTKQHYVIDVLSGLGMAGLFYGLFHRANATSPRLLREGREPAG